MAIRKLTAVAQSEWVGRYCCLPSVLVDRPVGEPALIVLATPAQLTCIPIPRKWRPSDAVKQGEFYYDTSEVLTKAHYSLKRCKLTSVICDTAEEAIALSNLARQVEVTLMEASKRIRNQFELMAAEAASVQFPQVVLKEKEVTHVA